MLTGLPIHQTALTLAANVTAGAHMRRTGARDIYFQSSCIFLLCWVWNRVYWDHRNANEMETTMNVSKIEAMAHKAAANAKPGYFKNGNDVYTFTFNQKHWYYEVYENGVWFMNVNTKTAAGVKTFLKQWFAN